MAGSFFKSFSKCGMVLALLAVSGGIAEAACYFVKTDGDDANDGLSWANAKATVAGAVGAVTADGSAGCEIRVADGIYVHTASITLPAAGVAIRGGYDPATGERTGKTVLSGDVNGNDQWKLIDFSAVTDSSPIAYTSSAYGAMIADGELVLPAPEELGASKFLTPDDKNTSDNVGMGFVVTGGETVFDGLYMVGFKKGTSRYGGTINTESAATATSMLVTNCVFAGGVNDRGAINFAKLSGARIVDSRFMYNRTSRIIQVDTSNNRFEGCDFIGTWKTGDPGGCVFHFQGGSGTVISNCLFTLNYDSSNGSYGPNNILGWQSHSGLTFTHCTVRENYTKGNEPLIRLDSGVMRNCLFERNRTDFTSSSAPSVMSVCARAEGCTFVSNTAYVAVSDATATVATAPVVITGARMPLVNCTFFDNRSMTGACAVPANVVKAGAVVVKSESTTADSCAALVNCTALQFESIPVFAACGVASSGVSQSKIVNSVLKFAGEGTGPVGVATSAAFPVQLLKSSVCGFDMELDAAVTAEDILADDLALDPLAVVDEAAVVPVLRIGARVEGNDDTYPVGNFSYNNADYLVYSNGEENVYLFPSAAPTKDKKVVVPDTMTRLPDALGVARADEGGQRGAVETLNPAALTGKTLVVRAKPQGVCTFTGPTTQVVQPGAASVPVTAVAVSAGSTFLGWQLADGTEVSSANPLSLDSLADDAVVYAVYSAAKVTYTYDLGGAGTFGGTGKSTIEVEYSIGDVPEVPSCTIDETRFLVRGWNLPSVVGTESATFRLDYVEKLHRIVRYDSAAADGGDGESWATAMNDLQAAIDKAALWTGEVWVRKGVHKPTLSGSCKSFFTLASRVTVKGGFAGVEGETDADRDPERNRSVLSGDVNGNDKWATSSGASVAVIDSETGDFAEVNPGHADDWWWVTSFNDNVGSLFDLSTTECDATAVLDGVWMTGCKNFVLTGVAASPTFRNCTFIGCGRLYLKSPVTIDGCRFVSASCNDGTTTGCIYIDATIPSPGLVVTNTLFDGVRGGQRGAITCNGASVSITLDDCTFSHCYMDPSNKNNQNNHGVCIGGGTFSATVRRCRFVGNKVAAFGHVLNASTVSDSLFEGNVIAANAATFQAEYKTVLDCGSAIRCSFVSNRVTRTGATTETSCAALVKSTGSLVGCTFDGNSASVTLDDGCGGTPVAGLVFVSGNVSAGIAHCTFRGNSAPVAVRRTDGNKNSGTYPLTLVNDVFSDEGYPLLAVNAGMNASVYGCHALGSVMPGFDETALCVMSAVRVITDEAPLFAHKPVAGETAYGVMLKGCSAGRRAAVDVFTDANGVWCFADADGTLRKLVDHSAFTPSEPVLKYADVFGNLAPAGKNIPGALQICLGGGTCIMVR